MANVIVATLSPDEARSLTDEVKQDAERLWRKLVELHDGNAHGVLGYSSWGAYFAAEFGQSGRHGERLLRAGRVLDLVASDQSVAIPNETQARELAPLLDQPEKLREVWNKANANGAPTALRVREAVERVLPPVSPEAREKQRRWAATTNVLDGLAHFDRPAVKEQAEAEAALLDQDVASRRGEIIDPQRLRNASAWTALLADALERRTA